VFLLYAIYRAFVMYYMQLDTGREIATRAQLVRAVAQRMRSDLRSAFTDWKPPTGPPQSEGQSQDSGTTSTSAASNEPATQSDIPAGGVNGASDSISMVVRVAPSDLDFSAESGSSTAGMPVSDVRVIRYVLNPTAGGASMAGLVREELARVPDETVSSGSEAITRSELLSEEITDVEFRYFDGSAWSDAWDTTQTGPPTAIEVILAVSLAQNPTTGAPEVKNYRFIIALATPTAGSSVGTMGEP
jgi:hypothetical protein